MKRIFVLLLVKKILVLLLAGLVSFQSMAAALPSYSPKFGNAMAGVVQQKVAARGFAANDPRFIATESAIGAALTATATGLAAAAGAPLWATIAVGAVAAGAVALGINALTQWIFNGDNTVSYTTSVGAPGLNTAAASGDAFFWGSTYDGKKVSGTNLDMVASSIIAYAECNKSYTFCSKAGLTWGWNATTVSTGSYYSGIGQGHTYIFSGQWTNGSGGVWPGSTLVAGAPSDPNAGTPTVYSPPPSTQTVTKPKSEAVADIPADDMSKPANPQLVAQAVNNAWQQAAAQPGYQGLPYTASDPVTSGDVNTWMAANPSTYPSVGDMLAPAVNPATSTVPQPVAPGTVASPGTATAPAGTPQVNLGTDPVIAAPVLEATPTAQMIMNPLLNLFPDLKSFVVPSHSAECPTPSASIFGRTVVMDGHCSLLETVRPTLYAIMAAVWVMIALFIILAA